MSPILIGFWARAVPAARIAIAKTDAIATQDANLRMPSSSMALIGIPRFLRIRVPPPPTPGRLDRLGSRPGRRRLRGCPLGIKQFFNHAPHPVHSGIECEPQAPGIRPL